MSEEGEKRFDPTPARLRRARREGDVPRAAELGASLALLAGGATLCAVAVPALAAARAVIAARVGYAALGAYAIAPAAAAACAGIAAAAVQGGGVRFVAPTFKMERLSPVAGARRIFSRDAFAHALRATSALAVAAAATGAGLWSALAAASPGLPPAGIAQAAWSVAVRAGAAAAATGCAFGLLELLAARRAWLRRLRMTFADYRRDLKEQDGDPQVRGRRRSLHRSLARGDVRRVRDAAFVLCNPEHVAVALAYGPPAEPVPRVLVCAAEARALEVRRLAGEAGVPIVENAPLARALFARAEPGATIPHELYVAVAEVVGALMRAGTLR